MKTDKDSEQKKTWWECACGARLSLSAEQVLSGKEICPQCGAVVGSTESQISGLSYGDTQMVNISEMARMAQQGVDVPDDSGEWDTSDLSDPHKKRRRR